MIKEIFPISILASSLIIYSLNAPADGYASVIETGSLSAESGDVGDLIGAEVKSVDTEGQQGSVVYVVVPVDPEKVDMVEIYDAAGEMIPQLSQPDLIMDYPDDRVGVKLHVKKKRGFEFRLRLIDLPDTPSSSRE